MDLLTTCVKRMDYGLHNNRPGGPPSPPARTPFHSALTLFNRLPLEPGLSPATPL